MKNIFSVKTVDGRWWQGKLSVRYNLFTVLKMLLGLVIVPFILLFYIGKGLYRGLVWLAKRLKPLGLAFAALVVAFWAWLRQAFKRKPKVTTEPPFEAEPDDVSVQTQGRDDTAMWKELPNWDNVSVQTQGRDDRWLWWLLLLSLLVAMVGTWRSCSSVEDDYYVDEPRIVYDQAFDEVIVARAYLDGVQEKVSGSCPRALVGFKFINDKPVGEFNFEGMTYDQAVEVVARDWKPLVVDRLNPEIVLSKQQMAVVTLAAMRMGKNGFARSTFLQKVNEGDLNGAGEWLLLQKKDGSIYPTGDEPKQYFYILRLLWNSELSIRELLDFPMFSYKGININSVYTVDGDYIYTPEVESKLLRGNYPTPREALELW